MLVLSNLKTNLERTWTRSSQYLAAILVLFINIYRGLFSGILSLHLSQGCRFSPTCSEYSKQALSQLGLFRGTLRAIGRILSCHPFSHKPHFDTLAESKKSGT